MRKRRELNKSQEQRTEKNVKHQQERVLLSKNMNKNMNKTTKKKYVKEQELYWYRSCTNPNLSGHSPLVSQEILQNKVALHIVYSTT